MNCQTCRDLFSPYLDGLLPPEEHRAMRRHLNSCLSCYRSWTQFVEAVNAVRSLPAPEPPSRLSSSILLALETEIQARQQRNGFWRGSPLKAAAALAALPLLLASVWLALRPSPPPIRTTSPKIDVATAALAPTSGDGPLVVLPVDDLSQADREIVALMQGLSMATAAAVSSSANTLGVQRARVFQIHVPETHLPRLMQALARVGYGSCPPMGAKAAAQEGNQVMLRIMVIDRKRGRPPQAFRK